MITLDQIQEGLVIPVDKPRQWTSFQAVNKVKSYVRNTLDLKKFKIGHAGTLDPLATGLLLICVGKANKSIDQLQQGEKVYTGTMVLGATTPCYDLERAVDQYYPYEHITRLLIEQTLPQFMGTIEQVPPMFSAVKIDGQRAYQYARLNPNENSEKQEEQPQPTAKQVNVYEFEITDFRPGKPMPAAAEVQQPEAVGPTGHHLYDHPLGTVPDHLPQLDFRIRCGKGTYIRSIARDLGLALGSGAFLSALRRERVGEYSIDQAVSLESFDFRRERGE